MPFYSFWLIWLVGCPWTVHVTSRSILGNFASWFSGPNHRKPHGVHFVVPQSRLYQQPLILWIHWFLQALKDPKQWQSFVNSPSSRSIFSACPCCFSLHHLKDRNRPIDSGLVAFFNYFSLAHEVFVVFLHSSSDKEVTTLISRKNSLLAFTRELKLKQPLFTNSCCNT